MAADITLDLDDDASLHDLAMIHHLLAMRVTKWKNNPTTEPITVPESVHMGDPAGGYVEML